MDIQYQYYCSVRIAPKKSYSVPVNLISISKKLGAIFVGSSCTIQVILGTSLQRKAEIIEEYECRLVHLVGTVSHIGLSNTEDGFAVIIDNENGTYLLIYKTEMLFEKDPTILYSLHLSDQADMVLEILWNPEIDNMLSILLRNGGVVVYTIEGTGPVCRTLAPESQSVCMSWSPKGKQIVIGNLAMFLTRYKPDLTLAGPVNQIPPPNNSMVIAIINVKWISNVEFIVVYNTPFNKTATLVISTPKNGPCCYMDCRYIDDADINTGRLQCYYSILPDWKTIIATCSNTSKSATFIRTEKGQLIQQKRQNVFPSLPSSFPVGMGLFYNVNEPCQLSGYTYSPMPLLCILSDAGLMVLYSVIHTNPAAQILCNYVEFPMAYRNHVETRNTKLFSENRTDDKSDMTLSNAKNDNEVISNENDFSVTSSSMAGPVDEVITVADYVVEQDAHSNAATAEAAFGTTAHFNDNSKHQPNYVNTLTSGVSVPPSFASFQNNTIVTNVMTSLTSLASISSSTTTTSACSQRQLTITSDQNDQIYNDINCSNVPEPTNVEPKESVLLQGNDDVDYIQMNKSGESNELTDRTMSTKNINGSSNNRTAVESPSSQSTKYVEHDNNNIVESLKLVNNNSVDANDGDIGLKDRRDGDAENVLNEQEITYDVIMELFNKVKDYVPFHELPYVKQELAENLNKDDRVDTSDTAAEDMKAFPEEDDEKVEMILNEIRDGADRLKTMQTEIKQNNRELYLKMVRLMKYRRWLKSEYLRMQNRYYSVKKFTFDLIDTVFRLQRHVVKSRRDRRNAQRAKNAYIRNLLYQLVLAESIVDDVNYHLNQKEYGRCERRSMRADMVKSMLSTVEETKSFFQLEEIRMQEELKVNYERDYFIDNPIEEQWKSRTSYAVDRRKLTRLKDALKKNGFVRAKENPNPVPAVMMLIGSHRQTLSTSLQSPGGNSNVINTQPSSVDYSVIVTNKRVINDQSQQSDNSKSAPATAAGEEIVTSIKTTNYDTSDAKQIVPELIKYIKSASKKLITGIDLLQDITDDTSDSSSFDIANDQAIIDPHTFGDHYVPLIADEILNAMKVFSFKITDDIGKLIDNIRNAVETSGENSPESATDCNDSIGNNTSSSDINDHHSGTSVGNELVRVTRSFNDVQITVSKTNITPAETTVKSNENLSTSTAYDKNMTDTMISLQNPPNIPLLSNP